MVNGLVPNAWTLVDPRLTSPAACRLPQQLLALATTQWSDQARAEIAIDGADAQGFLARHRVTTALRSGDVEEHSRAAHLERLLHINGVQLRIESTARQVLASLAGAGIDAIVLKGIATGDLDYPDATLRQTGDVDIAIPHPALAESVAILQRCGYSEPYNQNSTFLRKGVTLLSPENVEVDIHTRLFQRSPMSDIVFGDTEPLRSLPGHALGPSMRLLHAAGHFILAPPGMRRLSGLLDIALLRQNSAVDLELVRANASALSVEPLVGAALRLEAQLSGRADHAEALRSFATPDWLDRNTRMVSHRRLVLDHFGRFREVQRHDRLRYLPTWLLPDSRQRQLFKSAVRAKYRSS